jgi:hypothetical protein
VPDDPNGLDTARWQWLLSAPVLVVVAYTLLAIAWLPSSPATASPDEGAHYLRALAVASGQLIGSLSPPLPNYAIATETERHMWENSRTFTLPNQLVPPLTLICVAFHPERSAACQGAWGTTSVGGSSDQVSYVGNYQPYLYVVPGLFARGGWSFRSGLLLGRFANVLLCVFLVALAAAMLWDPASETLSLVGLLIAVTPMALFLFASVNTSGPEIAGGVCMTAGLLALSRRVDSPRSRWVGAAIGGAVLALGRGTGIGMALVIAGVASLLCGAQGVKDRARSGGWVAGMAVAAVGVAIVAGLAWELGMHFRQPVASPRLAASYILPALQELPDQFHQQVGVFGWLDTEMPGIVYLGWAQLVSVVVALAYLVGTRRQRWGLTAAIAGYIGCAVFIRAVIMAPTGFDLQGRYTLPVAIAVPLVAGEILRANFHRLGLLRPHNLPMMFAAFIALLQGIGWFANARRYAVGVGGKAIFLGNSEWQPAGGWVPWIALVAAGVALLAGSCWRPLRFGGREML